MSKPVSKRSSSQSTQASPPKSTEQEFKYLRYQRRGYGRIFACILTIVFFLGAPELMKTGFSAVLEIKEAYFKESDKFFILLQFALTTLGYIIVNIIYQTIYYLEHPFFEKYKIDNLPWPWYQNPKEWKRMKVKTYMIVIFNALVVTPVTSMILQCRTGKCECHFSTQTDDIPDHFTFFLQVIFCMINEDFWFHMGHRLLHWKPIYPYIHKVHHQYQYTIASAATYAHPVEYIIGNFIPNISGAILLGKNIHVMAVMTWTFVRLLKAYDNHSGYEFSFSPFQYIPMAATAQYHDFHHAQNIGNFSSFTHIWDTIFGSNKVYYQHLNNLDSDSKEEIKLLEQKLFGQKDKDI